MENFNETTARVVEIVSDMKEIPAGAVNIRENGVSAFHKDSDHVKIVKKTDKPGIDIFVDAESKNEIVHIPVVVSQPGLSDKVYNDFYIADGASVYIVAGCGLHNDSEHITRHDGIHTFHIGKNAKVSYIEKHYGEGTGTGAKILNPVTNVYLGEGSNLTMDMIQIEGVDSTVRDTFVEMEADSKMTVTEKLMTHDNQKAESNMEIKLKGDGATARIISRSVAKDKSVQIFHPKAIGDASCHAHVQCDSIIMGDAVVSSIPEITASNVDAQLIHEAAIGRINSDQLIKLRTFGLNEEEAEAVIIENFLK
ncbi:MAG: SufD family Fe-S cluster assembly protein [Lachnospiraceae bacterium]|nr:SufD family Fe-S cluster assembly protein [Lachnospiraceae bacterium]